MPRPTVAVTMWRRTASTFLSEDTVLHTLAHDYALALDHAGATTLMIGLLDPPEAVAILERVDGLVVTGGGDFNPSTYATSNTASRDIDDHADARDLALIAAARSAGMPTLGICRGLQALNIAHGGSLHQEVNGASGDHPALANTAEVRNAHRHQVSFVRGCRLASIYGTERRSVNSLHHQGIDRVGAGLSVAATTADGGVEAMESVDPDWWAAAVQWHPEMLADPLEQNLFDAFVRAAERFASHRPATTAPDRRRRG